MILRSLYHISAFFWIVGQPVTFSNHEYQISPCVFSAFLVWNMHPWKDQLHHNIPRSKRRICSFWFTFLSRTSIEVTKTIIQKRVQVVSWFCLQFDYKVINLGNSGNNNKRVGFDIIINNYSSSNNEILIKRSLEKSILLPQSPRGVIDLDFSRAPPLHVVGSSLPLGPG